jgi:ABC-type transport system substrate-binding protein
MQQQIEHEEADLALDSHVPETRLAALRADPERARRLSVNPSGTLRFLVLETNPKAGAIADVRVRQAVNHAIDKVAYRDAIAGSFAPTGKLASTILPTDALGYRGYDLYPTPGHRGDPAKAKALLAQAGHPHGLTLTFVTFGSGQYKANFSEYDNPVVNRLIDRALAEPDRARRAALWSQIDQRIMRDAPMVPLVWENYSFQWASRVHGWRYDPWTTGPDLTAVWLDPPSP